MDGDALAKTSTAASDGGGLVRQASSAALLLDSLERNGARAMLPVSLRPALREQQRAPLRRAVGVRELCAVASS
jgi:hypothetical protein